MTQINAASEVEDHDGSVYRELSPDEARSVELIHKIDINQATSADFQLLPRIGPKLAERIVAYREEHGEFDSISELNRVSGIGPKTIEKMRPFLVPEPQP